ncbi:MAG: hypothetical protein DLD55_00600 [candidate division SR1 bacterium]|nr:MAG: hypothetical protein DLD55_00600 [candidate division SR1 bacterium]
MPDIYQQGGFEEIVLYALGAIVLIISGGCIYAFLRAIFLFIFSKGDEKEIKSAWSSIRYMILGMFFTVMLLFVSPTLLKFMNVQGADKYTPKAIFTYMGKILGHIGKLGNIIRESQTANQYNGTLYYNLDENPYHL